MINSDAEKERVVLPQWRPFNASLSQRELFSTKTGIEAVDTSATEIAFIAAFAEFNSHPGPFLASDLLGVALRLGNLPAANQLAEYVAATPSLGPTAARIANETLGRASKSAFIPESLHSKIRSAKLWIRRFPYDAIAWVEQARLYTIIGQKKQAARVIERALALAPLDRYIVRSAVRFFIHLGDWDRANNIACKAAQITNDPWILSLWISTGSQLGKIPNQFKAQFDKALLAPDLFHHSELLEACATQEVRDGSTRKAKRAFRQAWRDPPKTVLSHGQWVLRERVPELALTTSVNFSESPEAMSWVRLMRLDLIEAVQSAREWALEEPFSSGPFMHASFIDTLVEKYDEAEALTREGLRANPGHHGLTNNLAFALTGQNKLLEAVTLLEPLKADFENSKDVALIATWGLIRMKQGAHEEGRKCYSKAIERAKALNDFRLTLRVVLNYMIAEVDSGGTISAESLNSVSEGLAKTNDARILATADRLKRRMAAHPSLFSDESEKQAIDRFNSTFEKSLNDLSRIVSAESQAQS